MSEHAPLDAATLEAIEARWAKATPGPWIVNHTDDDYAMNAFYVGLDRNSALLADGDIEAEKVICITLMQHPRLAECDQYEENAEAIAAAPTDVATLLAEVERLRALAIGLAYDPAGMWWRCRNCDGVFSHGPDCAVEALARRPDPPKGAETTLGGTDGL